LFIIFAPVKRIKKTVIAKVCFEVDLVNDEGANDILPGASLY
jgi:hypothetical protein